MRAVQPAAQAREARARGHFCLALLEDAVHSGLSGQELQARCSPAADDAFRAACLCYEAQRQGESARYKVEEAGDQASMARLWDVWGLGGDDCILPSVCEPGAALMLWHVSCPF